MQPKAPASAERVTAPAARALRPVAAHDPAVQVPATPTAHYVTRAAGETAAPVTRLAGDTLAAAALDRVVGTSLAPVSSIFRPGAGSLDGPGGPLFPARRVQVGVP